MEKTQNSIRESLQGKYPPEEIESFIFLIFNHLFGYSKIEILFNKNRILDHKETCFIQNCIDRLLNNEPIQYILGVTEFYGYPFKCRKGALIPRGETEELVHLILKENKDEKLRIIDLGTGTGCIPISIKKERKNAEVHAVDISDEALQLATENAKLNDTEIIFHQYDVLEKTWPLEKAYFDIIVSNPPYIRNSEKKEMEQNVLDFEPHLALFVTDNDPLLFYRAIAKKAADYLKEAGQLYFEINEAFGKETAELLNSLGFKSISIIKDLHNKDRIVKASK